jgi:outer membrane protein TolC
MLAGNSTLRLRLRLATALAAVFLALPLRQAAAQADTTAAPRRLSLGEAIRLAGDSSDAVRMAEAGVKQARSQELSARSQYWPELSATASYTRTLESQYETLVADSAAEAGDSDLSRAGFVAPNTYSLGLSGSFGLLTPGRGDQRNAARAARRSADIEVAAQRAQLVLDVTEAYYDAALSDRLVAIAESSLIQSERVLRQTQVARTVGDQSGYDLLRARVTRDNQVPTVLQGRSDRDLAYVRLKQLLNLDVDAPIRLTTAVDTAAPSGVPAVRTTRTGSTAGSTNAPVDTSVDDRAVVRQQLEAVRQQESTLRASRAQRLPSLSLTTSYGRVAYPTGAVPKWDNFRTNWTVGVSASLSLFTGGRQRSDELAAEASLDQARAELSQTRKSAVLDSRRTLLSLAQAEAAYASVGQTSAQASRAYAIAEVRYREGLASQTEVTDARIAEAEALSNRAQAARDLQVARVRLALLKDLPLSESGSTSTGSSSASQGSAVSSSGTSAGGSSSSSAATETTQAGQT